MAKVSFLGLGVMGFPMAGHLAAAGHEVTVYNRTFAKAEDWVKTHGGGAAKTSAAKTSAAKTSAAKTPREAAEGKELVFACVGNDQDLRSVTTGKDGAFHAMKKGSIFVDHTTASAEVARELAAAADESGFGFIDAPVSGGQAGAEKGQLTVMCGGSEAHYAKAEPLIQSFAKACRLMGPAGAGQLTKMVNQLCIAGIVQGLSEGLHFAQRAGLDAEAVVAVISKGAAQSWQMDNRTATMAKGEFDFGFAVNWMRKDLAICLDEARRNGAALPLAALVDQLYAEVQAMGGSRWDTSSLIARLPKSKSA